MALRDILCRFSVTVDQTQVVEAQRNVSRLVHSLKQAAGLAVVAFGGFGAIRGITQAYDSFVTLSNQLKVVTKGAKEFESAQAGVFNIAEKTFRPVDDVAHLFQRYSIATKDLGLSQSDTLDFTHRLIQATVLSGASAEETHGALIQLGQGISTNFKSAGQEIRSIQEQAPIVARIIAAAAGGSAGELFALAKAGKITSQLVVKAMRDAGAELDLLFADRQLTFGDLKQYAWTQLLRLMKQLEPVISKVVKHLISLALWTKAWVKDGSAMNSVIAAMIVATGTIVVLFGAWAASIALVMAPFVALFVVVEDFVTFLRGGQSTTGRLLETIFGAGGAAGVRAQILSIWEAIKTGDWEPFWIGAQSAILRIGALLTTVLQNAVAALGEAVKKDPYLSTVVKGLQLLVGKPGEQTALQAVADVKPVGAQEVVAGGALDAATQRADSPVTAWFADLFSSDEFKAGVAQRARERAIQASGGLTADQQASQGLPTFPTGMGPAPSLPNTVARYAAQSAVPGSATINNTITVQGNATPQVAREIASRTGQATAAGMGRGLDAIGASVGFVEGGI